MSVEERALDKSLYSEDTILECVTYDRVLSELEIRQVEDHLLRHFTRWERIKYKLRRWWKEMNRNDS